MKSSESDIAPFPLRLLRTFCPPHLLEEIEGDLLEKFESDVKSLGEKYAKRRLIWNAIRYLRPGIILRNKFSLPLNQSDMIQSYFKMLFRSLLKRKFYSAINLLCLTVGITFALLMGLFIYGELQVNQSLKDVDRLYLMESKAASQDTRDFFVRTRLAAQCVEQYPNLFEGAYRFLDRNITMSKNDKHFRIQSMLGDSSFITLFGFPVIAGNAETALQKPNSIVITRKIANLFFNNIDVVGQTLTVSTEQNGKQEYEITAVIENPDDKNSVSDFMNMDAQVFLSFENVKDFFPMYNPNSWTDFCIAYTRLTPTATVTEAEAVMNKLVHKNTPTNNDEPRTYFLNPISNYYLLTNHGAVQKLLWALAVVVGLILLLAISNFINISIASSFARAKEIGVRKVIGGVKAQVVVQFLLESCAMAVMSGVCALLLYEVLHPYFGELLGTALPSILSINIQVRVLIFVGIIFIGVLAGIYPAVFQSLAKPVDSLKGKLKSVQGTVQFSRVLIGTQFLITIFIFIAALVVTSQVNFSLQKDLGYNKDHVLVVTSVPRLWNEAGFAKMESAKKEFLQSAKIKSVSLSWGSPGGGFSPGGGRVYKVGTPLEKGIPHVITHGDEDYLNVYDFRLLAGSFLETEGIRQRNSVVINESAQKALGVQLGDQLRVVEYGDTIFTVKGVMSDFNFDSMHEKISPLMMMHSRDAQAYRYFSFKLEGGSTIESVQAVEQAWKKAFPDDPFDYWFADEQLKTMYTTELQMKKATTTATILMLVIVVTGILGLVSLSVSKRTKEIGIRKVLGASLRDILTLIIREYVYLILLAFAVAVPLTYWLVQQWLGTFAYRIELGWWMFALPGLSLLLFTVLLVAGQSLGTASTNPVKSLKYE